LTCRHCGRPIAVPASRCPWCGRKIMVVCAACKQYTDNTLPACQHCGAPLRPAPREEIKRFIGVPPEVADLLADRERAHLIASGVVAQYLPEFFFEKGTRRTVLVDLFGRLEDRRQEAAALLFAAVAYLVEHGYCRLEPLAEGEEMGWEEVRRWDGQVRSLEGQLARHAGMGLTIAEALDRVVREEMGFAFEVVKSRGVGLPGTSRGASVRNTSDRSALLAVVEMGRRAVLPEHDRNPACAETYRVILSFVQAAPRQARSLAQTILDVLEWFRQFEQNPSLALSRRT